MDNVNKAVRIIYIFLIAYICLIPFYYFPSTCFVVFKIPVIKYFPLILIAALFFLSVIKYPFRLKLIKKDKLKLSILLYFFLTLFSGIGTAYYPISIFKAIYYALTGILVYFIISSWDLNTELKVYFLRLMVFIGFLVSLYGIITLLLGRDPLFSYLQYSKSNLMEPAVWLKMGRISSSLANPLFLGGVLSLLFPISVYLYLLNQKEKKFPGILMIAQTAVILLGLVLTFSIGALAGIIFFYIYYHTKIKEFYKDSPDYKKVSSLLFLGVSLCCFVLFVLAANIFSHIRHNNYIFGNFLGKIDFQKITNIQGVALRWESLKYAAGFLKSPAAFFGIGIGKIGTGEYLSKVSLDNYLCLSLVESGIFATITLLLIFWVTISKASRKNEDPLYPFLGAGIIIFFINMLFFDALNQPVMRLLFWSFIGFIA